MAVAVDVVRLAANAMVDGLRDLQAGMDQTTIIAAKMLTTPAITDVKESVPLK